MYMLWAGHPKDESRTTHCVEEFLRHFNQQFYTPNPYIYWVIKMTIEIQSVIKLKITSILTNSSLIIAVRSQLIHFNIISTYEQNIHKVK